MRERERDSINKYGATKGCAHIVCMEWKLNSVWQPPLGAIGELDFTSTAPNYRGRHPTYTPPKYWSIDLGQSKSKCVYIIHFPLLCSVCVCVRVRTLNYDARIPLGAARGHEVNIADIVFSCWYAFMLLLPHATHTFCSLIILIDISMAVPFKIRLVQPRPHNGRKVECTHVCVLFTSRAVAMIKHNTHPGTTYPHMHDAKVSLSMRHT